ncbi:hypothetical protein JG687_00013889 [Phytophthora cactorum]|uniref:Uncharacterized protein n=1 Tax=Phytophthora cactorum TaxID=29920 RepID=A0A8T1U1C0_9STRA|nr:hypothetical protein PC120_g22808 [Phytophthora cactorum]KAG3058505.1 hypothetical protein PC121_g14360 [Phytophthora cactorum]KAG3187443.1 hypothetical protein PC128_g12594 [Phytophthora cactorum]KAG4060193.1 hypothetical protein PC123_g4921 [Phytophthora cactorum]KAG6951015.1 hypothetical protein JG687_00013889 [Phytophthora cactorum]
MEGGQKRPSAGKALEGKQITLATAFQTKPQIKAVVKELRNDKVQLQNLENNPEIMKVKSRI